MFKYKNCSSCNQRNHKSNTHCVRCGLELTTAEKFAKDVFAITLGIVILLSSATVFAGKAYFDGMTKELVSQYSPEVTPAHNNNYNVNTKELSDAVAKQIETTETPASTSTSTKNNNKPVTTNQPITQPIAPQPVAAPTAPITSPVVPVTPPETPKVCVIDQAKIDSYNQQRNNEIYSSDYYYNSQITHILAVASDTGMGYSTFTSNQIDALKAQMATAKVSINAKYDSLIEKCPQICN